MGDSAEGAVCYTHLPRRGQRCWCITTGGRTEVPWATPSGSRVQCGASIRAPRNITAHLLLERFEQLSVDPLRRLDLALDDINGGDVACVLTLCEILTLLLELTHDALVPRVCCGHLLVHVLRNDLHRSLPMSRQLRHLRGLISGLGLLLHLH